MSIRMNNQDSVQIRPATLNDAPAIAQIYNSEIAGSTTTLDMVERTLDDQVAWISEHGGIYPAVVCELDGVVVGFGALSPFRNRPGYSGTVEDSVYVAAGTRRGGVGLAILNELIRLASSHGFHSILALIGGGGEPSIRLHLKAGFRQVGVLEQIGRKHGKWVDVTVMELLV